MIRHLNPNRKIKKDVIMIPKYHELMKPILLETKDGAIHSNSEMIEKMSKYFSLTTEEVAEMLPSGTQSVIVNRTYWAITYLRKAKLIENIKRGDFNITQRGLDVLKENPPELNRNYLKKFEEFKAFQSLSTSESTNEVEMSSEEENESNNDQTPVDTINIAYRKMNTILKDEILGRLLHVHPFKFEDIVVRVIVNLGYGGSREEAGKALQRSGDEGIDGIINEDRLGLDVIYVQAKRYAVNNKIGRPDVQAFCGALMGKKARKGIFITTSSFTREAIDYSNSIDAKIILINGDQLAQYMIETNSGVETDFTISIKRINLDFFE